LYSCYNSEQINKSVDALYEYLNDKNNKKQNVLWDDNEDINLVIEPKLRTFHAHMFEAIRIPLAHSFRKDDFHDICIITRTIDVPKWENILLHKYPVSGLKKIIGLREFKTNYHTQESRQALCNLFDLFLFHPAVIYDVASKIVCFTRNANKSCAILPNARSLFNLPKVDYGLNIDYRTKIKERQLKEKKEKELRKQKK